MKIITLKKNALLKISKTDWFMFNKNESKIFTKRIDM